MKKIYCGSLITCVNLLSLFLHAETQQNKTSVQGIPLFSVSSFTLFSCVVFHVFGFSCTEILRHKCTWYCNVVDRSTALRSKCLTCTTALVQESPKPYWDKKWNCEAKKNSLQEQHRPWRCGVNYSSSDDVVITKYDRISFIHLIDMMWNDVSTHFFKQNILKTFVTYIANFTKLRK